MTWTSTTMSQGRARKGRPKAPDLRGSVVKPSVSKTAKYNQLPHWMQDNEYILAGYRWCILRDILLLSL